MTEVLPETGRERCRVVLTVDTDFRTRASQRDLLASTRITLFWLAASRVSYYRWNLYPASRKLHGHPGTSPIIDTGPEMRGNSAEMEPVLDSPFEHVHLRHINRYVTGCVKV